MPHIGILTVVTFLPLVGAGAITLLRFLARLISGPVQPFAKRDGVLVPTSGDCHEPLPADGS